MSEDALKRFAYHFKPKFYKRNDILYKQGDLAKYLYFIKSGEVELRYSTVEFDKSKKFEWDGRPRKKKKSFSIS